MTGDASAQHRPSQQPADGADTFVELDDGVRLRYIVSGSGPQTLVFIPGWTMHLESFEHQIHHFGRDPLYTVIAYDPRSQGRSTMTLDGNYYEQHAEDLRALLDTLDVESCVLVGWSAGSADIIEYLRQYGRDRVRGIVFIDIPPRSRGADTTTEWVEFGTKDNGDQDGQLRYFAHDLLMDRERLTREFCAWMLQDPNPDAVDFFAHMSLHTPSAIAALLNMSFFFVDGGPLIEHMAAELPILFVVRGEREDLARDWVSDRCPAAIVEAFGGHANFWEFPDRFNAVLEDFLLRVRGE